MSNFYEIQKLVELFNPKKKENEQSDSEDEEVANTIAEKPQCEVDNTNSNTEDSKKNPYAKLERSPKGESEAVTDLFDEELFLKRGESDWRKCPEWEITYRQKVTASDIYLQMGNKSPATASCENMIVSVYLPGENIKNIDLKITKQHLDVVSPNFKLDLHLPQSVDPQRGNAQWDKDTEKLVITLVMVREFDYINF